MDERDFAEFLSEVEDESLRFRKESMEQNKFMPIGRFKGRHISTVSSIELSLFRERHPLFEELGRNIVRELEWRTESERPFREAIEALYKFQPVRKPYKFEERPRSRQSETSQVSALPLLVFADWLSEHGRTEEEAEMRKVFESFSEKAF